MAQVFRGEGVGVGQEQGVVQVEVQTTTQRAPGIGRAEVEVCAIGVRHTTEGLVINSDVGLVEGCRGDVTTNRQFEVRASTQLGMERVALGDRVIAHRGNLHRVVTDRKERIEVVAQAAETHLALTT